MYISANIGGKIESRPYTPITSNDEVGFFELVIKVRSTVMGYWLSVIRTNTQGCFLLFLCTVMGD